MACVLAASCRTMHIVSSAYNDAKKWHDFPFFGKVPNLKKNVPSRPWLERCLSVVPEYTRCYMS